MNFFQEMMFQILGASLFLASGSLQIGYYKNLNTINANYDDRDIGLSLGSLLIITGILMFVDFGLNAKPSLNLNFKLFKTPRGMMKIICLVIYYIYNTKV